ncbi:NEDD8-activating enzyme E1 regulatory subunit [Phlyctochytrium planicorne]|nr:NEDD8-activating enzyme E1 regulatory subunit [Phlyctochytrium planicorne]
MTSTPPKVDKTQKYDRQLRLWQAHGQQALESSRVCLLNATATGTEILKNLILPGIGSFTVVDGKTVEGSDVGNNFFLDQSCIGKNRAKSAAVLVGELNEEVSSFHVDEDSAAIIENRPEFFKQFTIVITLDLHEDSLLKLSDICWSNNIPLVVVRSYGFIGYLRIAIPEHSVVETHPESIIDLRIDCPFPDLVSFFNSFDLPKLDSMQFAHVPYPVILFQSLEEWKQSHGGQIPSTYKEKTQFKELVNSKRRSAADDSENFDEAIAAVMRACSVTGVSKDVRAILDDPCATNLTAQSSNFWVLVRATREFVENEGQGRLPVTGIVPDMKADTETYVKLQTVYREKARQDAQSIKKRVVALLASIDRSSDAIPFEEIERFCKNASLLLLIRYRSIGEEYGSTEKYAPQLNRLLDDLDNHVVYYILLRAIDIFLSTHKKLPGSFKEDLDVDIGLLKRIIVSLLNKWQLNPTSVSDDHIQHMVRCGGAELPAIAGVVGGIVSQEVIKILTHQYIPLNNTLVYDGIRSTTWTYKF